MQGRSGKKGSSGKHANSFVEFKLYEEEAIRIFANIVYRHYHAHPTTPPSVLRTTLEKGLKEDPLSLPLTLALIELEERSKIAGRIRLHFDRICSKYVDTECPSHIPCRTGSTALWLMAIKTETSRERIKSLFERALHIDSA
jgi:hypothetical protein